MKLLAILALSASAIVVTVIPALPAMSHGGGLNAQGCHNNRKTGDYHCHRGSSANSTRPKGPVPRPGGAYRNCTEARAAGAAPVRRGDAGYGTHLDRDNDGVGCE